MKTNLKNKFKLIFAAGLFICVFLSSCKNPVTEKINAETIKEKSRKLTLFVYMAADNDLESYALQNLKAMERADFKKMSVLVLLDRSEEYDETDGNWTDTRLFEVCHDSSGGSAVVSKRLECASLGLSQQTQTELDMGNPAVLSDFISFGKEKFPAEKYALIIWGHGTGWRFAISSDSNGEGRAVAIDDHSGSYMSVAEIGNAIKNQGLSVIGFDTCFGGILENVFEIKECADFTVASAGITPSCGWDYKTVLENLFNCDFESRNIATIFAKGSCGGISVFDNSHLANFFASFEDFSKELAQYISDSKSRNQVLSELLSLKSYSYSQYPCDLYLDIFDMADFYSASNNSTLSLAAFNLKNSVNETAFALNESNASIGVHLIPLASKNTYQTSHSTDYKKTESSENAIDKSEFIKQSRWWVPSIKGDSGSLLDKLFYENF